MKIKNLLGTLTLVTSFAQAAPLSVAIDYTLKSGGAGEETRRDAVKTELRLEPGRWTPVGGAAQKTSNAAQFKGSLVRLVKSDDKTFELEFLFIGTSTGASLAVEAAPRMIGRFGLPMNMTTTAQDGAELSLNVQAKPTL